MHNEAKVSQRGRGRGRGINIFQGGTPEAGGGRSHKDILAPCDYRFFLLPLKHIKPFGSALPLPHHEAQGRDFPSSGHGEPRHPR